MLKTINWNGKQEAENEVEREVHWQFLSGKFSMDIDAH